MNSSTPKMLTHILQVNIDNINKGGAYELVKNVENEIAKSNHKIIFDYFTMDRFDYNQKQNYSSKLYSANLRKNRLIGHFQLPFIFYSFLKKNKYNIIHIHSDTAWKLLLYVIPAKLEGVPHIICHSHSVGIDGDHKSVKKTLHYIAKLLLPSGNRMVYLACSPEAEKWMFKKKKLKKTKNKIIKNGIDVNIFSFSEYKRKKQREKLNLGNKLVIGNTSKISNIKNPFFMLNVLENLLAKGIATKLLLVGNSDTVVLEKLRQEIKEKKLEDSVIIYGQTDHVEDLLDAMDIFVFPSKFEGLGISLIEAQTNGLPSLVSDTVPVFAKISKDTKYLSLNLGAQTWATEVENCFHRYYKYDRKKGKKEAINANYDIKMTANQLIDLYKSLN